MCLLYPRRIDEHEWRNSYDHIIPLLCEISRNYIYNYRKIHNIRTRKVYCKNCEVKTYAALGLLPSPRATIRYFSRSLTPHTTYYIFLRVTYIIKL